MQYFTRISAAVALAILSATGAYGRVGETVGALEYRLLDSRPRRGLEYPRDMRDIKLADGKLPYKAALKYMEAANLNYEVKLYWKTADSERAVTTNNIKDQKNPPGWDLYVVYVNDVSVMELYRRNGADISPFEAEGVLAANRAYSFWNQINEADQYYTFFGYQFERSDGDVRAIQLNKQQLLVFDSHFDRDLVEAKAKLDKKRELDTRDDAPLSIEGF